MPVTNAASGIKAGTIAHFAASTAPDGWLKANGAAISRTLYAALFGAIGTTYGVGDGATTFNVPDLRGEFVRGLDDGRGVDTGRAIGTAQTDVTKDHSHWRNSDLHNEYYLDTQVAGTNTIGGGSYAETIRNRTGGMYSGTNSGTETRPRNVAMLACIKF